MNVKLRLSIRGLLMFLPVFGVILWLWWFLRSFFFLLLLSVLAACMAVSCILLWCSRNGLQAEAVLPGKRVGKESVISFHIAVRNPSRISGFTTDIRYGWGNVFTEGVQSEKKRLWLLPRQGALLEQALQSLYAGRLEVRIEQFVVYDLFHIFYLQGCATENAWTLVWPGFSEESGDEISGCVENFPQEEELRRRGTDYNPDYEIREYIPGDELKSIHWKLTAKQNRFMVRERLASSREKINVLLPLTGDKRQNDMLMESLYKVCRLLIRKEYPIQLYRMSAGEATGCFLAEQGELERALAEILSGSGLKEQEDVQAWFAAEHPGEPYLLIQTGVYQGAYIR